MLKFLIVLFVIWLLARLAKRWLLGKAQQMQQTLAEQMRAQMQAQQPSASSSTDAGGGAAGTSDGAVERMVACAHCGLHIPQSEAVQQAGQLYCSQEHAQAQA